MGTTKNYVVVGERAGTTFFVSGLHPTLDKAHRYNHRFENAMRFFRGRADAIVRRGSGVVTNLRIDAVSAYTKSPIKSRAPQ